MPGCYYKIVSASLNSNCLRLRSTAIVFSFAQTIFNNPFLFTNNKQIIYLYNTYTFYA